MKKHIKSVISLTAICAVVSLLLAVTNYVTEPIIKKQESDAVGKALTVVLPNGEDFQSVELTEYKLPETVIEAYSEKNGGYVFKMTTTGYASGLVILCGIDAEGKVAGATCIASNETNKAETEYGKNVVNATTDSIDKVDTVGGSTKTTTAYRNAVKDALNSFVILNGGSVDLRSEEEILADNLKTALPSADEFTPVFITEDMEGIKDIYSANNGAGFVFVTEDKFIATDKDGNVLTETEEEIKTAVSSAAEKQIGVTLTEIDITKYPDMPTTVQKAYKTSTGNFVLELRAAGFGIKGDEWYGPSGEYIKIKVSVTSGGKIIACKTVSQKESDGIGSACEEPSFYTQFNGKEESNYSEIDAISGATITTNGYKTAISKVFEAVKILKGEN